MSNALSVEFLFSAFKMLFAPVFPMLLFKKKIRFEMTEKRLLF